MLMILGTTGHRNGKIVIDRFDGKNVYVKFRVRQLAIKYLKNYNPEVVFLGMAQGWDMIVAEACLHLGIPFVACIPFEGQEAKWAQADQERYHELLALASDIHITESDAPKKKRYLERNEFIVNNSDMMLAFWNGESDGGTAHCVNFAFQNNVKVVNLWGTWEKYKDSKFPFSNLQRVEIEFAGNKYPSVENYVQAVRIPNEEVKLELTTMDPFEATKLNRTHTKSDDAWEYIKDDVMREGLEQKFRRFPYNKQLYASKDDELVYWNYWHDTHWGRCYCRKCDGDGLNRLGELIMEIRSNLPSYE